MIGKRELDDKDIKAIGNNRYSRREFTKKRIILLWILPLIMIFLLLLLPNQYKMLSWIPLAYCAIRYIWFMMGIIRHEKKFLKEWKEN